MAKKKKIYESKLESFIKLKLCGIGIIMSIVIGWIVIGWIFKLMGTLSFLTVGIISFVSLFIGFNWKFLDDYLEGKMCMLGTEFLSILFATGITIMIIAPVWIDNVMPHANMCYILDDKYSWEEGCIKEESNLDDVELYVESKSEDIYVASKGYVVQNYSIILDEEIVEEVCFDNIPIDSRLHDDSDYPMSFNHYDDLRRIGGFWCNFDGGSYDIGDLFYLDWNTFVEAYGEK